MITDAYGNPIFSGETKSCFCKGCGIPLVIGKDEKEICSKCKTQLNKTGGLKNANR